MIPISFGARLAHVGAFREESLPDCSLAIRVITAPILGIMRAVHFMLVRPSWLVAATALSVCLPPSPSTSAAVHATAADVLSVFVVAVLAMTIVMRLRRLERIALYIFGPLVAALGVATMCSSDIEASLPGSLRFLQVLILLPLAVWCSIRDLYDASIVMGGVLLAGVLEGAIGLWQSFAHSGASFAGEQVRAVGTFGAVDIMAMATVVGFGLIVTLAFALGGRISGSFGVAVSFFVFTILAGALIASLSRGSWIAVLAAVIAMALLHNMLIAIRVGVCIAAALIVVVFGLKIGAQTVTDRIETIATVVGSPDQSVSDRYNLWRTAGEIWRNDPVTGAGPKNFSSLRDSHAPLQLSSASDTEDSANGYLQQPLLSPHNQYLLVGSEQGLFGFGAFIGFFSILAYGLWRNRNPQCPVWLAGAGFLCWMVVNFCYADLGGPTSVLFSIVLGVSLAASARKLSGKDELPTVDSEMIPAWSGLAASMSRRH